MRNTWITLIVTFVSLVIGGAIAVADDHGDSPLAATPLSVGGDPTSGVHRDGGRRGLLPVQRCRGPDVPPDDHAPQQWHGHAPLLV